MQIKEKSGLKIEGNFPCKMEDNLIYKALKALERALILQGRANEAKILENLHIFVNKKIPIFAGLGGGSSNAGKLLLELNNEYFGLSKREITQIASQIGSDASFFASGFMSANVSGDGSIVSEFKEDLPNIRIINSGVKCDTASIFRHFENKKENKRKNKTEENLSAFAKRLEGMSSAQILRSFNRFRLNNLLQSAIELSEELATFEAKLEKNCFFSGSGGCFFTWE